MINPKEGRGAQSVRPGLTIKGVLMSQIPLKTGKYVTEASITDIHNAYRELIRQENLVRKKEGRKSRRGTTVFSFLTLFRFARYLELVELVREEPMKSTAPFYSLRKDPIRAVVSTRRIYRLTQKGAKDIESWNSLVKTWMKQNP